MGNGCFSSGELNGVQHDETKDSLNKKQNAPAADQSAESKDFIDERLDEKLSLRAVSHCSVKPGNRLSLMSSKPIQLPTSHPSIDPDDFLSIYDLYNMLNDGGIRSYIHDPYNLLLIDCRSLQLYTSNHIITSKHHLRIKSDSNFRMRLSCYSMVIVYGNEVKQDNTTLDLVDLQTEVQEYIAGDVLVLREGFGLFQQAYPFLCTERDIETIADRKQLLTYPSMILDNQLFQGRGDQATNEVIIDLLKITHIVNVTLEHKNAFPKKIKYFRLTLEDVSETNLFEHFKSTSGFIADALSNEGRVLVHCTQGISRSSTITLAYLMKHKEWNLEMAFSTLKARRSCACPNGGFLNQLSAWEEELFGNRITNVDSL